jgi:hypothetical protein
MCSSIWMTFSSPTLFPKGHIHSYSPFEMTLPSRTLDFLTTFSAWKPSPPPMESFYHNNATFLTSSAKATYLRPSLSRPPCPQPIPSNYYPAICSLICLPTATLSAPSSICTSLDLTYHLPSTKFCSSCIGQPPFICRLSSASSGTSNPPSPIACSFVALHLAPFKPIQTPTRLAISMTTNPLVVFVSFLNLISFLGPLTNNSLLPALALNLNIALLLPLLLFGFNLYFAILVFFSPHPPPFGVTILVPHTFLQILPSMLVPSILKSIFILFVIRLQLIHWLSASL